MLLVVAGLSAQDVHIEFSYVLEDYNPEQIIDSLVEGHRAEIRYQFRVYQTMTGLRGIFGDRRVADHIVTYVTRWNVFNHAYAVRINDDEEISFKEVGDLLQFLLNVRLQRIPVGARQKDRLYVLCRTQIQPIKLVPPLTLMILIKPEYRQILPWRPVPFRIVGQ